MTRLVLLGFLSFHLAFAARVTTYSTCIDCVVANNNWCDANGNLQIGGCWAATDTAAGVGCNGVDANQNPDLWVPASQPSQCFSDGVGCETDTCALCIDRDHVLAGCVWCVEGSLSMRCVLNTAAAVPGACPISTSGTCNVPCPLRVSGSSADCGSCLNPTLSACMYCSGTCNVTTTSGTVPAGCLTSNPQCAGFQMSRSARLSGPPLLLALVALASLRR